MKKFICRTLGYIVKRCKKLMPPPNDDQIKSASKDVAWEYVTLLGSALEMATGPGPPMNHLAQEAFLVHVRNLAEFFREGIPAFKKAKAPPERPQDNIYAVDFCLSVGWRPKAFGYDRNLIKAINKTLSHMTYSRDPASKNHARFEGYLHLHGTVKLMRQTWGDFLQSVKLQFLQPQCPEDIHYWLVEHTKEWPVKFSDLESGFEARAQQRVHDCKWKLNQTPDGPV
jgi:hypothetical protein